MVHRSPGMQRIGQFYQCGFGIGPYMIGILAPPINLAQLQFYQLLLHVFNQIFISHYFGKLTTVGS